MRAQRMNGKILKKVLLMQQKEQWVESEKTRQWFNGECEIMMKKKKETGVKRTGKKGVRKKELRMMKCKKNQITEEEKINNLDRQRRGRYHFMMILTMKNGVAMEENERRSDNTEEEQNTPHI